MFTYNGGTQREKMGLTLGQYNYIHLKVRRTYKKSGVCEECNEEKKTQLANKSGTYQEDLADWIELCHKCHYWYDAGGYSNRVIEQCDICHISRPKHKGNKHIVHRV